MLRLTRGLVRPFLPSPDALDDSAQVSLVIFLFTISALGCASAGLALLVQPAMTTGQALAQVYALSWPIGCALLLRWGHALRTVLGQAALHGVASVILLAANTGGMLSPVMPLLLAGLAATGVGTTRGLVRRAAFAALALTALLMAAGLAGLLPPDPVPPELRGVVLLGHFAFAVAMIVQAAAATSQGRATFRAERTAARDALLRLNRELDARVAARTAELEAARIEAEQASLGKSRFLAQMSHELRTPLNAVIGFAEIMRMGLFGPAGSPRYAQYVAHVEDSGRHLLSLVNDLLDLSRIDAGDFVLKVEQVDLDDTITGAMTLVATNAEAQGIALRRAPLDRTGVHLWADRRALRQALANLLANAAKFTPRGGQITVAVEDAPGGIAIRIQDTGCGIAPAKVAALLTGIRGHDAMARDEREGAGLGFAITRGLIARHGGQVELESTPGQGTCVRLVLPAERLLSAPVAA